MSDVTEYSSIINPSFVPGSSEILSFDSFLTRRAVHRRTVAEVLLTDCMRTADDRLLCAAQWSRSHRIYRPQHGVHDSLLVAESLRQAGICVAHRDLGVPEDFRFIMDRIDFTADLDGMVAGLEPADVVLEVNTEPTGRRTSTSVGFWIEIEFLRNGRRIARAAGWARCVAPAVYWRVRGPVGAGEPCVVAPVEPALVGMCMPEDVVVGASTGPDRPLRVLTQHPILFDHPLDHVPGMLILEAMRQSARLATGRPQDWIAASNLRTRRFLELDLPATVTVVAETPAGPGEATLACKVMQAGRVAAEAILLMIDPAQMLARAQPRSTPWPAGN